MPSPSSWGAMWAVLMWSLSFPWVLKPWPQPSHLQGMALLWFPGTVGKRNGWASSESLLLLFDRGSGGTAAATTLPLAIVAATTTSASELDRLDEYLTVLLLTVVAAVLLLIPLLSTVTAAVALSDVEHVTGRFKEGLRNSSLLTLLMELTPLLLVLLLLRVG